MATKTGKTKNIKNKRKKYRYKTKKAGAIVVDRRINTSSDRSGPRSSPRSLSKDKQNSQLNSQLIEKQLQGDLIKLLRRLNLSFPNADVIAKKIMISFLKNKDSNSLLTKDIFEIIYPQTNYNKAIELAVLAIHEIYQSYLSVLQNNRLDIPVSKILKNHYRISLYMLSILKPIYSELLSLDPSLVSFYQTFFDMISYFK